MNPSRGDAAGPPWPGRQEIRAILRHLPTLQRPAGELWQAVPATRKGDGTLTMGYPAYGPEVSAFREDLYRLGFVRVFDWSSWSDTGMALQRDPQRLAAVDLTDLVKLLSMHVRAERFSDGHLADALEHGWFVGILGRLAEIDQAAEQDPAAGQTLLADRDGLPGVG